MFYVMIRVPSCAFYRHVAMAMQVIVNVGDHDAIGGDFEGWNTGFAGWNF